jgi:hypothetical protein
MHFGILVALLAAFLTKMKLLREAIHAPETRHENDEHRDRQSPIASFETPGSTTVADYIRGEAGEPVTEIRNDTPGKTYPTRC